MDTKKLRQKILDLAIRGKLVPQDPNDEPASVLLERIRAEKERLIQEGKIKRSKKSASDDEIEAPFEIPESWEWVRLDALCDIKGGKRIPHGMNFSKVPTEHVYLRVTNMKCHTIIENEIKYIDEEVFQIIKNYTISSDDLYLTIAGTIGDVGVIPLKFSNMNLTENAAKLTNLVCDKQFLMYALLSTSVQNHFSSKFHQVAQPKLSIETASSAIIALPPLAEQKRIANAVEHWFTLIDELESNESNLLKAIDKAKSKILDLAIHGKLVPQDPNDEPAIELLKRINPKFEPCDEVPWELPNNWCWTTIGSIFNHNTGKALNKSDSQEGLPLPYITTSNVYWNRFVLSDIKKMFFKDSEIDKCTVTKGDLLVCEGGDIGRSAIWNFDYDICIQNHIHRLRAKGDISHLLYLYVLMFYKWTDRIQGKGIGLQGLSSGLLDKLIVPLPPYAEQLRIVAKIEELFAVLDGIKESLE